jgi:hypothetical protein
MSARISVADDKSPFAGYRLVADLPERDLPITFRRDGETLIGELHLAVTADLRKCGRDQAERDIRLLMKNALL